MPDNDPKWKIPTPRDYLAIKYAAPPGACKCGECQLVPPEILMAWDAMISGSGAVRPVRKLKIGAYHFNAQSEDRKIDQ